MPVPHYLRVARSIALVGTTAVTGAWWVGCQSKPTEVARDPEDKAARDGGNPTPPKPPPVPSGACSGKQWFPDPPTSVAVMRDVVIPCAAGSHCTQQAGMVECAAGSSTSDKPTRCGVIECDQFYCTCTDADAGLCHCPLPMPTPGPLPPPELPTVAARDHLLQRSTPFLA